MPKISREVPGPLFDGRGSDQGELAAIESLTRRIGLPRRDEIWVGDDAAVLHSPSELLFATDVLVEGVHFTRDLGTLADVGWKALASNLSDVAAMGGSAVAAVVAVVGSSRADLEALYDGLLECAQRFDCPVVGGDLSAGALLSVSVAIVGDASLGRPVLRSGAQPGDVLFVTGDLGAAAAGLSALQSDPSAEGVVVDAFLRPQPRLAEGRAASRAGASAMLDISDGLALDLDRLCRASDVGAALDAVPTASGATPDEAREGGEDYELLFSAPSPNDVMAAFRTAGLKSPIAIGRVVSDRMERTIRGMPFPPRGYTHGLA